MEERRKSRRKRCRLRCTILKGEERKRGCILDVSEGGLCLLSPIPFGRDESFAVQIDVPRIGVVEVRLLSWHVRRVSGRKIRNAAWSVGAVIVTADAGYSTLLPDGDVGRSAREGANAAINGVAPNDLKVFKVRVKQRTGPRTRLLSLTAADEEEARRLAVADVGSDWSVVDFRRAT